MQIILVQSGIYVTATGTTSYTYASGLDSSWCLLAFFWAIFFTFGDLKKGGRTSICRKRPEVLGQSRGEDSKLLFRHIRQKAVKISTGATFRSLFL